MFVTLDFETEGIVKGSPIPPKPIGIALKYSSLEKGEYLAWGHNDGNNISLLNAIKILKQIWESDIQLVFHNAKFDLAVAKCWLNLKIPKWERIHDTMLLLFLNYPDSKVLALKPMSEAILNLPPDEKDQLGEWFLKHQPVKDKKLTLTGKNSYMGYLKYSPGNIVSPYGIGDVSRTEGLFNKMYPTDMQIAYDRERQLLPLLMQNEKQGIKINVEKLGKDIKDYESILKKLEERFNFYLGEKDIINSSAKLLKALKNKGVIDESKLLLTKKGNYSASAESLEKAVTDESFVKTIKYYKKLLKCMNTFLLNWYNTAKEYNGRIYTTWNQVKSNEDRLVGTRTGRLSSSPNMQNAPNTFEDPFDGKIPKTLKYIKPLPNCREYIIPDEGHTLIGADWCQQELRLLAHFEQDLLFESYQKDLALDVHNMAQKLLSNMVGQKISRDIVKNIGFGLIYGMGVTHLASISNCSYDFAKSMREAYLNLFPGIKRITTIMDKRAALGQPITTWGGRRYYCEEVVINGSPRLINYKMINTLIQGSAGDCLKQAIINFDHLKDPEFKLLLTVHDEILISVPKSKVDKGKRVLKEAMESVKVSVKLLTDMHEYGDKWGKI